MGQCMPVMFAGEGSEEIEVLLKSVQSLEFIEVVQIDQQKKINKTETEFDQILRIIDHFTKLTEAVPCQTASEEETC